jgi:TRAP-type C4-dicarboxylate transport system substrate-binding protein
MNIITGDAVNFEDPAGKPAGENKAGEDPNGPEASEKLGSFDLTMSMSINTAGEDISLAEKIIEYFDEIKEATDGHVATTVYPGGSLAGASEIYDYLSDGVVDIGLINPVYAPDKFNLSNAFSLPLQGFDDSVKATEMIWDLYEEYPEFAAEWNDKFEVLQLFVFPESIVKTNELTPLDQIMVKGTLYGICVNKDLWNLLPSEYQEIIKDHSGRKASIASAEALKTNYRIQTEWLQGMGKTILDPSDEKYGQWKSACDVFAIQWAEEASAASGVDAAAFLNRAKELYAHY